jgi:nitrogen-specific signal transduction histidine kinase
MVRSLLGRARTLRQAALLRKLTVLAQVSNWFVHEVRNPLSGILNSAQLLSEKSSPSCCGHDYLKIITEEGDRLEQFLRRLTEVGRSSKGPIVPVVLNAVAERALSRARPRIRKQGIRVRRRFDPRLPEVQIEAESVEQVIWHLVAGALERMPEGGVLSLLTRYRFAEKMIELEVADTGGERTLGQDLEHFDPFFFTKREATTGLAIASALRAFSEYGGTLSFHSNDGQGGSVRLQLPLKRS